MKQNRFFFANHQRKNRRIKNNQTQDINFSLWYSWKLHLIHFIKTKKHYQFHSEFFCIQIFSLHKEFSQIFAKIFHIQRYTKIRCSVASYYLLKAESITNFTREIYVNTAQHSTEKRIIVLMKFVHDILLCID